MKQELQVSILKELIHQIDSGENLDAGVRYKIPASIYACPDLAKKEWETFFKGHPQLIGLSSALPEPFSFLTMNDFGIPVLATRDKDGRFRAFLNACRHRATRVEMESRGKRKLFVCPFHAWSYASDGALVAVADESDFGHVDKSCHGLVELPSEEVGGMLWVHPDPNASLSVAETLSPALLEEMASNSFQDFVYAATKTLDMKLNWKLANDTFGETYHFQKLHKNTLGQLFVGNNTHYKEFGRNHRFATANVFIHEMQELPEDEWRIQDATFIDYHLFPNIQFIWSGDIVNLIRIYPHPKEVGRSITQIDAYFTKAAYEAAMAADDSARESAVENLYNADARESPTLEATMEVFNSTVRDEDYVMGEYQQQAAESDIAGEAFFGRNEPILHHFHRSFREALGLPHFEIVD